MTLHFVVCTLNILSPAFSYYQKTVDFGVDSIFYLNLFLVSRPPVLRNDLAWLGNIHYLPSVFSYSSFITYVTSYLLWVPTSLYDARRWAK